MTNLVGRITRIGIVAVAAAVAVAGLSSDAVARQRHHQAHLHKTHLLDAYAGDTSLRDSSTPGTLRYYGGPKSPMWREAR